MRHAACFVVALAAVVFAAPAGAANTVQVENARPGTTQWRFPDPRGAVIEGYASEVSVLPGETVHFHVSTDPPELYHIHVYRLGWYGGLGAREVACIPTACPHVSSGTTFTRPENGWAGARWPVTDELRIGDDWVSGYYLARFELRSGDQEGRAASALFVVRPPPARRSPIVVQVPVNTWQAYNPWGGKSLYDSLSVGGAANRVSFERPMPPNALQTWEWEIQLLRFLERDGYDVSYQTDVDTHREPAGLLGHRLVIVNGHDEYWSSPIRDAFDTGRDAGTNLAFIGANIGYWQVRYEDGERTLVGYKSFADPVTDPRLQTVRFRELTPPRPECALLGTQWNEGKKSFGDPPRDYAVNAAALTDPWFAGTGFGPSTVLPDLVGPEWDPLAPSIEACRKPGLQALFHYSGQPSNADAVRYVAPSGARVFSAGSLQFAWGLDDWLPPSRSAPYLAIPGLQQFMRNVLADLSRPAPPLRVEGRPERGNLVLTVEKGPDPRIRSTVVTREGRTLCEGVVSTCVDQNLPGHRIYVYEAVNVDEWGRSAPLVVRLTMPNSLPRVTLRGPRTIRRRGRAVYRASATDRDGDAVAFSWRLDGRPIRGRLARLAVRFQRPGRHTVEARARDGHGGTATARLTVRVS